MLCPDSLVGPEYFVGDLAEEDLLLGSEAGRRRLPPEGLPVEQRHLRAQGSACWAQEEPNFQPVFAKRVVWRRLSDLLVE